MIYPTFRTLTSIILLFAVSSLTGQKTINDLLEEYYISYFPEKVYVHTDKAIYAGGETIWAAVYLLDGRYHRPDSTSKTIYLELHDPAGEVVVKNRLYAFDGHTSGSISLPASLVPGNYQLTAYTNYQRNSGISTLFRRTLEIVGGLKESGGVTAPVTLAASVSNEPVSAKAPTLDFFPEGGDCVAGLPCRVAVAAAGPAGLPMKLEARLLDDQGKEITRFLTEETGIGKFTYTPEAGTSYRVIPVASMDNDGYDLPAALAYGTHLEVNPGVDTVTISISAKSLEGLEGSTLLLHLRGLNIFEQTLPAAPIGVNIKLPVAALPAGVIVATVFDLDGQPVAERLFFVSPTNSEITVQATRENYGTRAPARIRLAAPYRDAPADSLAPTRISLSILPQASAGGPGGDDIRTWLLLNSDLDRPIAGAPDLIFATSSAERMQRVDDLLLTRAWRRFRWEDLGLLDDFKPDYLLEPGLYLRGRMTRLEDQDSPRPGKLFLTRMENGFSAEEMTDEAGFFSFGPLITFDTFPVAIQGRFKFGKKNRDNPEIDLDDNSNVFLKTVELEGVKLPTLPTPSPAPTDSIPAEEAYAEISRKALTVARTFDSLIIDLDVVDISATRIDKEEEQRRDRSRLYGGRPDTRIVVADSPRGYTAVTVLDLIRGLPGVTLTKRDNQDIVVIRGNAGQNGPIEPIYVLDGAPTRLERLINMPVATIEFIDVVKGPRATALGADATGGAIAVYTYADGRGRAAEAGLLNTEIQGYQKVREFATFDATLPANRNRPDLRTTLHWVADLRTDERGRVDTDFVTSDQLGRFIVVAQGLRRDGTPFYGSGEFTVGEN